MSVMPQTGLKTAIAATVAAIWGVAAGAGASAGVSLPAYFSPGMPPDGGAGGCPSLPTPPASAPKRVWQQTTPPQPGATCQTFAFGPLTDASEQAVGAFSSSQWRGGLWPRIWARRGPRPRALGLGDPGSNPIYPYIHTPTCDAPNGRVDPNLYLGDDYSSVAKANAVTEAEILHMLGASAAVWRAPLQAAGFNLTTDIVSYTALSADPDKFVKYTNGCNSHDHKSYVTVDKFILHDQPGWVYVSGRSTPPTGVMIDYEVNDFRPSSQGSLFLANLAQEIHGISISGVHPQVYLYTNPWIYVQVHRGLIGGMAANGFDFLTIDAVKSSFDYLSLYILEDSICNIDKAYSLQLTNLRGVSGVVDSGKLTVTVDFTRCTVADALDLFNLNVSEHFGGYAIYPHDQLMGGRKTPLTNGNLLLWTLLYGSRPPP